MSKAYEEIAARKRAEQNARIPSTWRLQSIPDVTVLNVLSIPSTCGILTPNELEITENYDAVALAEAIASQKLTSEQVVTAFSKRAAIAQQLTNCLTEIMFEDAVARAKWLDAELARTGRPIGPLHGVPVSVKDTFRIKGYDSSIGISAFANKPSSSNSHLIDLLLAAGAVLYVKTNVPQTLMALDSQNHLFGRVLNPANRLCTAGGSSGGEGALIAMRGSVLGVGTDVGGSIRIPSMCNGLYGLKPSCGRVPYGGQVSGTRQGMDGIGIKSCAGPIASSLRDIQLFMQVVADGKSWEVDNGVIPGAWDHSGMGGLTVPQRPLIAIVRGDGLMKPLPPIQNVLEETAQALRRAGVDTIELDVPAFKKCQSLANGFLSIDGNNTILDILDATSEPLIPWLSSRVRRKPQHTTDKILELHVRKVALHTEMLKIWQTRDGRTIDAFICPVAPHPVPEIDRWNGLNYTLAFNLLDYPAGVLPVRTVHQGDLVGEVPGVPSTSWDERNRELWDKTSIDRNVYLNTALCVQIVVPQLQERRLFQAMEVVDSALKLDKSREQFKL